MLVGVCNELDRIAMYEIRKAYRVTNVSTQAETSGHGFRDNKYTISLSELPSASYRVLACFLGHVKRVRIPEGWEKMYAPAKHGHASCFPRSGWCLCYGCWSNACGVGGSAPQSAAFRRQLSLPHSNIYNLHAFLSQPRLLRRVV